jgi:integrase/recombinase XerD
MSQGKQAKVLTEAQIRTALQVLSSSRYQLRDRTILLLSIRAGLRAKEIALLTWRMVTDPEGAIGNVIALEDVASKGCSGRTIPISRDLREALRQLREHEAGKRAETGFTLKPAANVITSERGDRLTANSVAHWFKRLYGSLGFDGCSSHSGRRTAITKWARNVSRVGGSLRDVQELAGHSSLQTTQRYVQGDSQAKRRLVDMV